MTAGGFLSWLTPNNVRKYHNSQTEREEMHWDKLTLQEWGKKLYITCCKSFVVLLYRFSLGSSFCVLVCFHMLALLWIYTENSANWFHKIKCIWRDSYNWILAQRTCSKKMVSNLSNLVFLSCHGWVDGWNLAHQIVSGTLFSFWCPLWQHHPVLAKLKQTFKCEIWIWTRMSVNNNVLYYHW